MEHVPVLVDEVLEHLGVGGSLEGPPGGSAAWVVDCTLGLGGHALAMLRTAPWVRVLGLDRDPQALAIARERLAEFADRVELVEGDYREIERWMGQLGVGSARGVLVDLGVSSLQLDTPERGFSFRREGPLDMRMGPGQRTAGEIVNRYPEAELQDIFSRYGEERQARRVARAIVEARRGGEIRTTRELQRIVADCKRARGPQRIDPATRVFQALRIEVNRELAGLDRFIEDAIRMLDTDGRLVVISYHSLEDRIVKHTLRNLDRGEVDPVTGRTRAETRLIEVMTRRPVRPGEMEIEANPRSRSARLRAARRL
jgi:16S rRNA (cytosine1402-N4)-methyltransferase